MIVTRQSCMLPSIIIIIMHSHSHEDSRQHPRVQTQTGVPSLHQLNNGTLSSETTPMPMYVCIYTMYNHTAHVQFSCDAKYHHHHHHHDHHAISQQKL